MRPTRIYSPAIAPLASLAAPLPLVGGERSLRLAPQQWQSDRLLLGFDLRSLAEDDALASISAIAQRLDLPVALRPILRHAVRGANQLLLGYEGESSGYRYRLYLEYWQQLVQRLAQNPGNRQPALLHLGLKWREDGTTTLTRYLCTPLLPLAAIALRIHHGYTLEDSAFNHFLAALLILLQRRCGRGAAPIFLEASDESTPRRSFDLNLYKCQLTIADLLPLLQPLLHSWQISAAEADEWCRRFAHATAGHIAAGRDQRQRPFITLYHEIAEAELIS
jgi:hypothetical protein